MRILQSALC